MPIRIYKLFYFINFTLILLNIKLTSGNKEINNLLINDLNIIATKLDEIPETSLNLKLVLLAYECNDLKLNWKVQNQLGKNSKQGKLAEPRVELNAKIFGYQVVVREYLEPVPGSSGSSQISSEEFFDNLNDKTLRVYSSKFIDSHQNKFKLVNLLRRDTASYLICLIIYMDVTETVAFEKQCINFSLPTLPKSVELACKKSNSKKKIPKLPLWFHRVKY